MGIPELLLLKQFVLQWLHFDNAGGGGGYDVRRFNSRRHRRRRLVQPYRSPSLGASKPINFPSVTESESVDGERESLSSRAAPNVCNDAVFVTLLLCWRPAFDCNYRRRRTGSFSTHPIVMRSRAAAALALFPRTICHVAIVTGSQQPLSNFPLSLRFS